MTVTPIRVDGADLSHYQAGTLDLPKAKAAGVRFLYHKATEGTSVTDDHYATRRTQATKAGIPLGAYHFARPSIGDAAAEAAHFLAVAKPGPGDMVPMLDLETNGGLTRAQLTTWVGTWVAAVRKATGAQPIIYTPYDLDHTFGCHLWVARYSNTNAEPHVPAPWHDYAIRQFSNGVYGVPNTVAGLGHVDLDHLADDVHLADLRIPTEPDDTDTATRTGTFRAITQNVKALPLMPEPDVTADVTLTARQAGIVGWQEIGPDRYKQAVQDMGATWATFWGHGDPQTGGHAPSQPNYDSPISWRTKHWTFVAGGREVMHDGEAKVSATRFVTWVLLRHTTGAQLLVLNGHLVADAWRTTDPKPDAAHRQDIWRQDWKVYLTLTATLIGKHPEAAVLMLGDYNANLVNKAIPWGAWKVAGRKITTTFPKSIDHLFMVNGTGAKWDVKAEEVMPGRHSDHQGRRVQARLAVTA